MATRLHAREHSQKGGLMFEVWNGHQFIGGVYALPGRGIRVISKYRMTHTGESDAELNEIRIEFAEREA